MPPKIQNWTIIFCVSWRSPHLLSTQLCSQEPTKCTVSWYHWILSTTSHHYSFTSVLISSSHVCLSLSLSPPSRILARFCMHLPPPIHVACTTLLTVFTITLNYLQCKFVNHSMDHAKVTMLLDNWIIVGLDRNYLSILTVVRNIREECLQLQMAVLVNIIELWLTKLRMAGNLMYFLQKRIGFHSYLLTSTTTY